MAASDVAAAAAMPKAASRAEETVEEKWQGGLEGEVINAPAEKAWKICGNFCALNKWLKTVESCEKIAGEFQRPGCVRAMVGTSFPRPDGSKSWAHEELLSMDEANYSFTYAMRDNNFGFTGYANTFRLSDLGNGTSAVDWCFSVDPIDGRTEAAVAAYMTAVFRKSLQILEDLVNSN